MSTQVESVLVRARAAACGLIPEGRRTILHTVRHLGVVQSQDFLPALWSVAQRMVGPDGSVPPAGDLLGAFDAGHLVRTHVLRPTWHLIAPQDLPGFLALTAPRVRSANGSMLRRCDLDAALLARCRDVIAEAITSAPDRAGVRCLTREEVRAALGAAGVRADGLRLVYILMDAELSGLICSGPRAGRRQTYALTAERLERVEVPEPPELLRRITLRYFLSHGPATERDFAAWSGLTLTQARRGVHLAASDLVRLRLQDLDCLMTPETADRLESRADEGDPDRALLLQQYDELLVSQPESRRAVDVLGIADLPTPDGATFRNPILYRTQLVGWWKATVGVRRVTVHTSLPRPAGRSLDAALEAEARRYVDFALPGADLVLE